ncbi:MAG: DUF433 domain-containing protein [Pyrinomonadaceae bacterium]
MDTILELLSSGMTVEEILADYEELQSDDILACIDYSSGLCQIDRIETLSF